MGRMYLNGQEVSQDEKATPLMSNNDEGLEEEDYSSVNGSELQAGSKEISSKLPLIWDINQSNNSRKCSMKSYPCRNKLTATDFFSFLGLNKNLSQHNINLVEDIASDFFCRTMSLFNIPMDLNPIEFFTGDLKYLARTRSTSSLGDFTQQCASVTGPGNFIISTSGQSIFGSVEGTVNARALLESSLFLQLATIDSTRGRVSARKFRTEQTKSAKLANSPSGLCNTSSQEHKTKVASPENQRSDSKISEKRPVSCSSTNSTCSYQSTSSLDSFISKGQLHCMWSSGTPSFAFTMGDDCSEVYMANPIKIEFAANKGVDYMYLFHSRIRGKRESRNYSKNASGFVGKMKVSSSLTLNSNQSKAMETEFVLFGADGDHSKEMQSSAFTLMKNKGLSKKVANIFRPSNSFKHKSNCIIGEPSSRIEDFFQGPCRELRDFDESYLVSNLENDSLPNVELAAIVIKDYRHDCNETAAVGGWGLKFLKKITDDHVNTSRESSFSSHSGEGCHRGCGGTTARSMKVLVPAGIHGGPTTRTGGPSSLTERWRSGGHCDCGGWDIGCPLTVLSNSIVSEDFPQEESQEDRKSINLFIEGAKDDGPALKMVNTNEGVYSIYFRSTLSALQSFSIGVAIIHTQLPAFDTKL